MSQEGEQQGGTTDNPAGGSPPSPSGDAAGDASQAQLAQAEARRRDLQSQLDKVKAENEQLKAAQTPPAPGGISADDVARMVNQGVTAALAQRERVNEVATKYPDVDLKTLGQFESVDALEAAAAAAQDRATAAKTALEQRIEADVLKRYEAKFGKLPTPAPAGGESGTPPKFTAAQVARMTVSEQIAAGITSEDLAKISRGEAL